MRHPVVLCFVIAASLVLCTAPAFADAAFAISGQHRWVYRYSSPVGLGIPAADGATLARKAESLQLLRNTVQVEARWHNAWRAVLQVGGWYALGSPERAQPPDADLGDVAAAFVEWSEASARVRLGRQDLPLGSTRWFSTRDGANVRQTLDLLRATLTLSHTTLDVFAGAVPRQRRGWFDDLPSVYDPLLGMYGTLQLVPAGVLALDLYTLHRERADLPHDAHFAGDKRTTFGMSTGGATRSGAEYIQHTLLQVGEQHGTHYVAWGLSAAFWQRLPGVLRAVRLGLRLDALSGDKHAEGKRTGSFDPLFPNQTFFSPHPAIYPSNLYSVHPLFTVWLERLKLEGGCILLWRQSVHDGIYESNAAVTRVPPLSKNAHTGEQLSMQLGYEIDAHFETELVFSRLFAGRGIRDAGGTDVSFFGSTLSFRY